LTFCSNLVVKKQKPNDDTDAQCTVCRGTFSVGRGGRSDVDDHFKSEKHKFASRASPQSGKVSNFFSKVVPDKNYLVLAAREATFSHRTVIRNRSFRSVTYVRQIRFVPTLNDKKFTRAKTKEIVENVI